MLGSCGVRFDLERADDICPACTDVHRVGRQQRRAEFEIRAGPNSSRAEGEGCETVMAERSIGDRERYVGYATHCLQLAKATADRQSRAILKEMAAEWLKLAEAAVD
jgi:hypothetical protein